MERADLAQRILDVAQIDGRFRLRSGRWADHYFDKYLFEAEPTLLSAITAHLVTLLPPGTEVLAGLELGGVPLATALSLQTGIPVAFVRKEQKAYGTEKLAEGAPVTGRRVVIVEDVVTTGGQVARSATALRNEGAEIDDVLCVVDRSGGDHPQIDQLGLHLTSLVRVDMD
jgi:orotate phosphoribosyltransferase